MRYISDTTSDVSTATSPRICATQIMTYDNWTAIARPIGDEYPIAWLFFILWIAIAAVGLLNLLTAVRLVRVKGSVGQG